jgi:AcrR family transcriptional regulator
MESIACGNPWRTGQQVLDRNLLFLEEGYENVSLRRIAGQIECSPTTIYHHFKDKSELFFHLLEGYHGRLLQRMEKIYRSGKDPAALLALSSLAVMAVAPFGGLIADRVNLPSTARAPALPDRAIGR